MNLVRAGQFSFRYRGYLLPIAVVLLLLPSPALMDTAALPAAIGLVLALAGQLWRVFTISIAYVIRGGKDHEVYAEELQTHGLYNHCRNPMYFGNLLILAGVAVASNSWLFVMIGVPLVLLMYRSIIAAEEDMLVSKFGAAFDDYRRRVPRWVPNPLGMTKTLRGVRFDWQRVLREEYATPVDWLAGVAIIVLVNLGFRGTLAAHPIIAGVAIVIICVRLVLWRIGRRLRREAQSLQHA